LFIFSVCFHCLLFFIFLCVGCALCFVVPFCFCVLSVLFSGVGFGVVVGGGAEVVGGGFWLVVCYWWGWCWRSCRLIFALAVVLTQWWGDVAMEMWWRLDCAFGV
jgi:hypothetical protein